MPTTRYNSPSLMVDSVLRVLIRENVGKGGQKLGGEKKHHLYIWRENTKVKGNTYDLQYNNVIGVRI